MVSAIGVTGAAAVFDHLLQAEAGGRALVTQPPACGCAPNIAAWLAAAGVDCQSLVWVAGLPSGIQNSLSVLKKRKNKKSYQFI